VAAAKNRAPREIQEAIDAGIQIIGENYVQEAEESFATFSGKVKWHFIGHLQKNKVKRAVKIFDLIETADSVELAEEINKRCASMGKVMPVLCEVNIAREEKKSGVFPEEVEKLVRKISTLKHIKVSGLMNMGPFLDNPEDVRVYFKKTRQIFEEIKKKSIPNVEMKYLSMGMSSSYKIAIEEGANIVRIGTKIFGPRDLTVM
ncbi:YggS family pyridoxal phosphate-dependent enzyme, partial [Candidatus Aerophobetes bacterium]|nr:YggS family pyridoxal phosphate-dependent enzyme [Candidatus Aerophobetes bacterium]